MSDVTLKLTRRQAVMVGALLEADLQERGLLLYDREATFVVFGPPWYPTSEENQQDVDLFNDLRRTVYNDPRTVS